MALPRCGAAHASARSITPDRGARSPADGQARRSAGRPGDRPGGVHPPRRVAAAALPGTTIIAAARYPATGPTTRLAATLERTPDSALAKFQLDVESPGAVTVILAAGSGARLIVRTVAKGSESGRELPGGPDVVLLDDRCTRSITRWPSSPRRRDGR